MVGARRQILGYDMGTGEVVKKAADSAPADDAVQPSYASALSRSYCRV
jgi:hypothetical protein